ncbi:glycosyltransferase family 2 protein [Epilithonimonas sp.]|uniref:glycosyltransferase family 2 protein n=1 Tax=Epilithonimonas sp. TaxID=2894511 RepID=UPI00289A81AC|nr:glycosyltransferase family 2 protein [Epilithonimonas sp.]
MKKVATIIVTYNGGKWIEKCLNSVQSSNYPSDIFVVDNASTDNTLSLLESYNIFDLEISDSNLGFGAANNIALNKALKLGYDYFFLINQDVYIEENTLEQLIRFSIDHIDTGIVVPIQYDGNGDCIDNNFKQYISLSKDMSLYFETTFANAAAWLISEKCLVKTGNFNPIFSHYGEDRNYCDRVLFHNFSIKILKGTKVLHDRQQKMSLEKSIKLSKIKLLSIFLNPNFSKSQSLKAGLVNVFGMGKYFLKKHHSIFALFHFIQEYIKLFNQRDFLESVKNKQKFDQKKS